MVSTLRRYWRCLSEKLTKPIRQEKHMDRETDTVGEYQVPVDPMDDNQCDSCQ